MTAADGDAPLAPAAALDTLRDRYRGLLWGLALGDAVAAPAQHRRAGTFTRIGDLIGGGPYDVPCGAWTDDTAVPRCLLQSLVAVDGFDRADCYARLSRWQLHGEGSATGQCLGISATLARALAQQGASPGGAAVEATRTDREPLARAGIAAAFALADPEQAIALAAELARLSHAAPVVVDTCRYVAALTVGALQGVPKAQLLAGTFSPVPGLWQREPLRREVASVAAGGWQTREDEATALAAGDAVAALALLLGALARGTGYRDTVLAVVNLGQDADANGALVGQLAGALYGAAALPVHWLAALVEADGIGRDADRLLAAALARIIAA